MGEELEIKENVDAGMNAETIADMNAVVQGVDAPAQPFMICSSRTIPRASALSFA